MRNPFRKSQSTAPKTSFYNAPAPQPIDPYANKPDPAPGLAGDYQQDPARVQAPSPLFRTSKDRYNSGPADASVYRSGYPDVPSTQYYKEQREIPRDPAYMPAHGVFVPDATRGYGWKQTYVPAAGMRAADVVEAPPPMLNHPIVETTVTRGYGLNGSAGKRVPMRLKAPKPYRRDS